MFSPSSGHADQGQLSALHSAARDCLRSEVQIRDVAQAACELVANSLDAGATSVCLHLEGARQ